MLSYGVRMSHCQKPYTGYTRPYSRLKFCHRTVSVMQLHTFRSCAYTTSRNTLSRSHLFDSLFCVDGTCVKCDI